jgi:F-type H+-transporting ATPase subunit a
VRFDPSLYSDTLHTAVRTAGDTLAARASAVAGQKTEGFEFGHLLDHIRDAREIELPGGHLPLPQFPPVHIGGTEIDLSMTKVVFFMLFSSFILVTVAVYAARQYRKSLVPTGLANLIELVVVFFRDEVALPNMGPAGLVYLPYLLSTFFLILIMNLFGLIPYGATATSNIAVTGGLATVAFIMIQVSAIRAQGLKQYLHHMTGGVHWALWPIMIPIEVLGLFTKPFALCMRLFANMSGGHIVLLSLFGLIFLFRSLAVAPVSVVFALAINMLELFVAFLQAYVFTMLTSLFMGLGIQAEVHEEAHEQHGSGHS